MPHARTRYLERLIRQGLSHAPLVGVLGQRQTGKTTLVRAIAGENYVTLDDPELLGPAQESPKAFTERTSHPFAIDECQLAPALFPALKLRVQKHPKRGQFILTGSVRFSARKAIRESLTGRIQLLELHPMTLAEASGREAPDLIAEVEWGFPRFEKLVRKRSHELPWLRALSFLETGGLPGICFLRDEKARRPRFSSHLDTILGRDLSLVSETNIPVLRLRELLAVLARRQGEPIALTDLSRSARISTPALRKVLNAFEALFLIRRVLPIGDTRKETFFLEDQGTASYLAPPQSEAEKLIRLIHSQLVPHLEVHDPGGVMTYRYETRNGASVPLVFQSQGKMLGILPLAFETPDRRALASAQSFLKHNPGARVLILTRGTECVPYTDAIWVIPVTGVF